MAHVWRLLAVVFLAVSSACATTAILISHGTLGSSPAPQGPQFALAGEPGYTGLSDPCSPVHVAVHDPTGADIPLWLDVAILQSVSQMADASGIPFTYDRAQARVGTRSRDGSGPHAAIQILLSPDAAPLTDDGQRIRARASVDVPDGQEPWVGRWDSGTITIYPDALDQDSLTPDGALPVVMHELGHLLGLDHVDSGTMSPAPAGKESLDVGTRAALGLVGCRD